MSATIVPFIKDTVFGPDAVAIMGDAFDRACAANRIIELAKTGERHPQVLCDRALEALGLPGADRLSVGA